MNYYSPFPEKRQCFLTRKKICFNNQNDLKSLFFSYNMGGLTALVPEPHLTSKSLLTFYSCSRQISKYHVWSYSVTHIGKVLKVISPWISILDCFVKQIDTQSASKNRKLTITYYYRKRDNLEDRCKPFPTPLTPMPSSLCPKVTFCVTYMCSYMILEYKTTFNLQTPHLLLQKRRQSVNVLQEILQQ